MIWQNYFSVPIKESSPLRVWFKKKKNFLKNLLKPLYLKINSKKNGGGCTNARHHQIIGWRQKGFRCQGSFSFIYQRGCFGIYIHISDYVSICLYTIEYKTERDKYTPFSITRVENTVHK